MNDNCVIIYNEYLVQENLNLLKKLKLFLQNFKEFYYVISNQF